MKFAVDCMLGKLAKWLKILGFDASFFPKIDDDDLLALAVREERTLLTRDTGLLQRAGRTPCLFIGSLDWMEQVRQVIDFFGLDDRINPLSRCLECNRPLTPLPRSRVRNLITPFVYETSEKFSLCPDCGRVYWKGSHLDDMKRKIDAIMGDGRKAGG